MAAGENRFAPELNEKEVIELLENTTPGKTQHHLSIRVSQSKTMLVEKIYKLIQLISYISLTISDWLLTPGNKFEEICLMSGEVGGGGVFNKTIIPLAFVGYEMIIANEARSAELAIYHLIFNAHSWNNS